MTSPAMPFIEREQIHQVWRIVLLKTELAGRKIKKNQAGRRIQSGSSLLMRDFACG